MKLRKIFAGLSAAALAASMMAMVAGADEPMEVDGKKEAVTDKFNMLLIATDIAYDNVKGDAPAKIGESEIHATNVTLKMAGQEFTMEEAPNNMESGTLCFMLINEWNPDLTPIAKAGDYKLPGEGDYVEITFTLEGADGVTGKAGIAFQTNTTWNFRNNTGDSNKATFPATAVGVQGGGNGVDTKVDCTDVDINGNGTYTVKIAASGTINEDIQKFDDGTERSGRQLKWAMDHAYEYAEQTEESKADESKTEESKADESKAAESKAAESKASSSKASSSKAANSTAAASSAAASDNTNAATGATAGIALAGLALAGAVAVVSKRK